MTSSINLSTRFTFAPSAPLDLSQAACASGLFDPELWFPHPTDDESWTRAKSVCAVCPIRSDCLEFGIANKMTGVWGGADMARGKIR